MGYGRHWQSKKPYPLGQEVAGRGGRRARVKTPPGAYSIGLLLAVSPTQRKEVPENLKKQKTNKKNNS